MQNEKVLNFVGKQENANWSENKVPFYTDYNRKEFKSMAVSSVGKDTEQLARWELVDIIQINMHIPYLPASF